MYRNKEGYADPTAGLALSHMMKEYRQGQKKRYADKNRRKVYVASRYAGDVVANTTAAIGYCRRVIQDGYMPIASHLLYPQILDDKNPAERELGLSFGLALLQMCDEVWVFGKVTKGMAGEIEEAKKLKKQIRYFEEVDA
ncbi:DUF7768 domain-containing protein [Blautia faecis]|jgi:hypothetical protein|uniref:DUF7768 domain-containing protein n=1 Tax=Lachnospiraceae TaxID=186803 RepID=UPI000EDA6936|nr:DUF4406 domain-containing protein [Blautia faecis]MBC8614716.1 hypothetical protein [Blautia faecis]HCW26626.1 hypothetical protein [Lachnoclostridium sp.]